MEISEVRIKLVENSTERLRAFCSITLDGDFVIRDLKIIEGINGAFVAMPSRKLADRCSRCGNKNHLRARFCSECGQKLRENRAPKDAQGRAKLHADIAHPINAQCRERIQNAVLESYGAERERAQEPGYKPISFDDLDEDFRGDLIGVEAQGGSVPTEKDPTEKDRIQEEDRAPSDDPSSDHHFSEYDSLIADLKRDAASRNSRPKESWPGERGSANDVDGSPRAGDRSIEPLPVDQRSGREEPVGNTGDEVTGDLRQVSSDMPQRETPDRTSSQRTADTSPPAQKAEDEFGAGLL